MREVLETSAGNEWSVARPPVAEKGVYRCAQNRCRTPPAPLPFGPRGWGLGEGARLPRPACRFVSLHRPSLGGQRRAGPPLYADSVAPGSLP